MDKDQIEIRPVGDHELQDLHLLARRTFLEAFGPLNKPENITAYSEKAFSFDAIKAEFLTTSSRFYFAVCNEKILGYLKLNAGDAQTERKLENALEIERIYVTKDCQSWGVGQLLLEKAVDLSHHGAYNWLWLGVWEHNPRAIRFYERHGFIVFDSHDFLLGDDPQTDLLMRKEIRAQG